MPASSIAYRLPVVTEAEQLQRLEAMRMELLGRRSCRFFSERPVSRAVIEAVLEVANTAPSGANRKPWRFVAVDDPAMKRAIRAAAEKEERENYAHRFPVEWLEALEPLGTSAEKPFLEVAPWLIVVLRIDWEEVEGRKVKNYYPVESTGIASGLLLMAAHRAGLATLTHTPNPMDFLREICGRPRNEKPFLLIPMGYPAEDATVPDIAKLPLAARLQWNAGS